MYIPGALVTLEMNSVDPLESISLEHSLVDALEAGNCTLF